MRQLIKVYTVSMCRFMVQSHTPVKLAKEQQNPRSTSGGFCVKYVGWERTKVPRIFKGCRHSDGWVTEECLYIHQEVKALWRNSERTDIRNNQKAYSEFKGLTTCRLNPYQLECRKQGPWMLCNDNQGLSTKGLMTSSFGAPSSWAVVGRSLLGSSVLTAIRHNFFLSLVPFILPTFRQEKPPQLLCFHAADHVCLSPSPALLCHTALH